MENEKDDGEEGNELGKKICKGSEAEEISREKGKG